MEQTTKPNRDRFLYVAIAVLTVLLIGAVGFIVWQQGAIDSAARNQTTNQSTSTSTAFSSTSSSTSSTTTTSSSSSASSVSTTTSAAQATYKVYFADKAKQNASLPQGTLTSVTRRTSRVDALTFALEQMIVGPSEVEKAAGLSSTLAGRISGTSNCGGANFVAQVSQNGVAEVKFCKQVMGVGSFADGVVLSSIAEAAFQFPAVSKVLILDQAGKCLFDQSGLEVCKDRGYTFQKEN